jgi:NADH-quinone oxidoreductase subunit N
MNAVQLLALLPLILLGATPVVLMLAISIRRSHALALVITLAGLLAALIADLVPAASGAVQVTPLLVIDGYARFFIGLLIAAGFLVAGLSFTYLHMRQEDPEEYYLLLTTATLGAAVLAASSHFASFFLGLEILSVSLYALIAYRRSDPLNVEAGIKYLILAGASSAFLLFGMGLVYAAFGSMAFARVADGLNQLGSAERAFALTGFGLMIVGIGFKLAVVPFHMWTPDVYEGAPAPVTAFVATVSKGGMFALLIRLFSRTDLLGANRSLFLVFAIIAVASMVIGNLLALLQNNVKRILAYSSIAHLGYLLVAFLAGAAPGAALANGTAAAAFYLVAYFVTTLGAFGVVTVLSGPRHEAEDLNDYEGLFWRRPALAVLLTAALLSLAGIPLTAGFVGKFFLVAAGVGSALWLLVVVLVLTSVMGLFYYLRIVVVLYARPELGGETPPAAALSLGGGLILAALGVLLLWLGVYPTPFIQLVQAIAANLG